MFSFHPTRKMVAVLLVVLSLFTISSGEHANSEASGYDALGEAQCMGRKCLIPDDCCSRTACVDPNGVGGSPQLSEGICVPLFPASGGELCDGTDCPIGRDGARKNIQLKQYNEECTSSAECDTGRGLCCQFMRRHRMAPRQVCSYFVDPKRCVVLPDQRVTEDMVSPQLNSFFKALIG